jgi:hypothetical protein
MGAEFKIYMSLVFISFVRKTFCSDKYLANCTRKMNLCFQVKYPLLSSGFNQKCKLATDVCKTSEYHISLKSSQPFFSCYIRRDRYFCNFFAYAPKIQSSKNYDRKNVHVNYYRPSRNVHRFTYSIQANFCTSNCSPSSVRLLVSRQEITMKH